MAFLMGVVAFILGSALVAVCLVAIPGPDGEKPAPPAHGHGGH
jgi:hypothetical protein